MKCEPFRKFAIEAQARSDEIPLCEGRTAGPVHSNPQRYAWGPGRRRRIDQRELGNGVDVSNPGAAAVLTVEHRTIPRDRGAQRRSTWTAQFVCRLLIACQLRPEAF